MLETTSPTFVIEVLAVVVDSLISRIGVVSAQQIGFSKIL